MTDHLATLDQLEATIAQKRGQDQAQSYTAMLLAKGTEKCAKKFGEEAVELALASMGDNPAHITAEAADVLYHLLVLLAAKNISLEQVMAELAKRQGMSGHAEKAARGSSA